MNNNETEEEETEEPPDKPQNSAASGTQYEKEEENAELEWARRHIREEPAAPKREPARAPDPKPPEPEPEEEPEYVDPIAKGGRGKGRPPHRMLKEAVLIAKKRGGIIRVPGGRSDAFDLIICEEARNVFVRLRWSGTRYLSSRDVLARYHNDIGRIVRLPMTGVMAWEVWLREPQDVWQFFLITHDGLVEILNDGTIHYRPVLPVPVADEAKSTTDDGGYGNGDGSGPAMEP